MCHDLAMVWWFKAEREKNGQSIGGGDGSGSSSCWLPLWHEGFPQRSLLQPMHFDCAFTLPPSLNTSILSSFLSFCTIPPSPF